MICGYGSQSLAPLPESGGVVTFTGAQFGIEPGQRYGVEMRIVRVADGVHGRAQFADLLRVDLKDSGPKAQEGPKRQETAPETASRPLSPPGPFGPLDPSTSLSKAPG